MWAGGGCGEASPPWSRGCNEITLVKVFEYFSPFTTFFFHCTVLPCRVKAQTLMVLPHICWPSKPPPQDHQKWRQGHSVIYSGLKRSTIAQEGVNGQEVIWTKLPPDATAISPASNTQTFPLSLPFRAPAVVTFVIYPQFLLILFGLQRSLRATLGSSLDPGVYRVYK